MLDVIGQAQRNSGPYNQNALITPPGNGADFADAMAGAAETTGANPAWEAKNAEREASLQMDPLDRRRKIAEISGRYDVTNISPNEIDKMTDELYRAGYGEEDGGMGDLFMLMTWGAEFQEALSRSAAEHFGEPVDEAALQQRLNSPINMIDSAQYQRDMSKSHGQPTDGWDSFIKTLEDLEAMRNEHHRRLDGEGTAPATLATLLAAQEQAA